VSAHQLALPTYSHRTVAVPSMSQSDWPLLLVEAPAGRCAFLGPGPHAAQNSSLSFIQRMWSNRRDLWVPSMRLGRTSLAGGRTLFTRRIDARA
jgi:hypothetical protein